MVNSEFQLTEAQSLAASLGFTALSMRVDNPTNAWIQFNGLYRIPPLTFGGVLPLVPGTNNPRLVMTLTNPDGSLNTGNGQAATIIFYDEALPPAAPSPWAINISGGGGIVTANQGTPAAAYNAWPIDIEKYLGATMSSANPLDVKIDNTPSVNIQNYLGATMSATNALDTKEAIPNTNIKSTQIAVSSSTATALPTTALTARRSIAIQNNATLANLYLGDSAVTSATGTLLTPGQQQAFTIGPALKIYGIAQYGTPTAATLEVS